jgi:hypothetical protein
MTAGTILRFQFGSADAIREIARSRAALVTGIALVLITTIPRNYDQLFIADKPLRWIFGSLGFSVVSGTWVYCVTYGTFIRRRLSGVQRADVSFWSGWPTFMGFFWMTAPIAWLHALPVERFMDSLGAAKANLALLGIVSFWRVALMARVLNVVCGVPAYLALIWILLAASVETIVATASTLPGIARPSGLRVSPEDQWGLLAYGTIALIPFLLAPILFLLSYIPLRAEPIPFPQRENDRIPKFFLATCALGWVAVSIVPQIELAHTARARGLVETGQYREVLDYYSAHLREDFAPAVPLPPRTFRMATFGELSGCVALLRTNDAPWVKAMMFEKLNEMEQHTPTKWAKYTDRESFIGALARGPSFISRHATEFVAMFENLSRLPEGPEWLRAHDAYVLGVRQRIGYHRDQASESDKVLVARLLRIIATNSPPELKK